MKITSQTSFTTTNKNNTNKNTTISMSYNNTTTNSTNMSEEGLPTTSHHHNHHNNGVVSLLGDDDNDIGGDVLCVLWIATAGQGDHLLGTDEENIVYLRMVVYHTLKRQTLEEHQFVVLPDLPPPSSNSSNNNNNNTNNGGDDNQNSGAVAGGQQFPIKLTDPCTRNYQLTEERIRSTGEPLHSVLQRVDGILESVTAALDNNTTNLLAIADRPHNNSNSNINNSNINNNNGSLLDGTERPSSSNSSTDGSPRSPNRPILVTDGQLHLRQVLHPKSLFLGVNLPATYKAFFDLRKEFRKFYNISEEVNTLQEMVDHLNVSSSSDVDQGARSTSNMINVISKMVEDGHAFTGPERIHVRLVGGIIPKGEDVDSGCVVRARGLPWMSSDTEIAKFFRGLNLAKGGVALCLSPQGRRNGEALIRFECPEHRDMALRRHKHHMGGRYIEVYKATGEDFISVAGGNNNEATQFLARGNLIIRMRGLPYDCTARQVVEFFETGDNGVRLLDNEDGVLFVRKPDGRATGDAFVLLKQEEDANKALTKHRELIGSRYIELFRSTAAEVMNRSMDIRHLDQPQQQQPPALPPLIAQLPTMPPLIPQQSVAHGPRKDCIRLRGLPFEAHIEHVLEFLGEFAKSIMFRGVHMVYTPQGQPSGEAFIQMTNELAAWNCTQHKHNRYMYFGKKNRYIEVFQCSGDDMNFVLSGGLSTAPAVPAARPIVSAPGGSPLLSPYGAYPLGPATTVLSHALPSAPRLAAYPAPPIAAPYPMFYWPYPSPPVSPTSGYYSSLPHHAMIPSECIPIHTGGELAIHPGEAVATM